MLYGKFATRTHRSSPSSAGQSHDIASAWTISTLKDPTTSARAGSKCRSTSMAVTLAPVAASATGSGAINAMATLNGQLFAATAGGIVFMNLEDETGLVDPPTGDGRQRTGVGLESVP